MLARKHDIEQHAERKNIRPLVGLEDAVLLGRGKARRAEHLRVALGCDLVDARGIKVDEHGVAAAQDDVFRFDVAVHRDVKPENVILRGSDAVLIDFDAARIYKVASESDTQVLGTTGFAAPEQYGIFQSDERADIFSLGVLLNIMLTGKHPSREMAAGKMGRIVRKCTMTAPEQRYQSARALMEVL